MTPKSLLESFLSSMTRSSSSMSRGSSVFNSNLLSSPSVRLRGGLVLTSSTFSPPP
nr:MAG TPA: hypothetical protein [Caudoviricetes sp.]